MPPPPPSVAVLPERVLSVTVSVPLLKMPRPLMSEFVDRVVLLTLTGREVLVKRPPPLTAVLPESVLPVTASAPVFARPPPLPWAVLPVSRHEGLTVSVPALQAAPP